MVALSATAIIFWMQSNQSSVAKNDSGSQNSQTDAGAIDGNSSKDPKDSDSDPLSKEPTPNVTSKPIPKLAGLPIGVDASYQIRVAETQEEGMREWTGTATIRPESPSSPIEFEQILTGARTKKTQRMRALRYATGIKIPNRWILVGSNLVQGAQNIKVEFEGLQYRCSVRHELPKSGFAVLQIEDAKLPKFPKLPMLLKPKNQPASKKLVEGPFTILWLDAKGEFRTVQAPKSTSATSSYGGKYFFTRTIPDDAVGGLVFLDSGKPFGMVNDSNFPALASTMQAAVIPLTRVAKTWPDKTQAVMFDSSEDESTLENADDLAKIKTRYRDRLVKVIIEQKVAVPIEAPLRFDVNLKQNNPKKLRDYSDVKTPFQIRDNGILTFKKNEQDAWTTTASRYGKRLNLPYYLGNVVENLLLPMPMPDPTKWNRSRIVYIKEDGTRSSRPSGGAIKATESEMFELVEESESTRTIQRRIDLSSTETSEGTKPSDSFFALPIKLTGEQIIEYSKEENRILSSHFVGTIAANKVGKKIAGTSGYEKVPVVSNLEMQIELVQPSTGAAWHLDSSQ